MANWRDRWLGPAILGLWALLTLMQHWGSWSVDLSALYFAGLFYGEGIAGEVYNDALTPAWIAARDALGHPDMTQAPFIYPPWVAAWVSPLAQNLTPVQFFNLGFAIAVGSIATSVLVAARLFRPSNIPLSVWCAVSVALLSTSFISILSIDLNQPQNLVNFLTLSAFLATANNRPALGGGMLAFAAAIKLSPALFALIWLAERNYRALGWFFGIGAAMVVMSLAVAPWTYTMAFLETINRISDQILISKINHSIETLSYVLWQSASESGFGFPNGWAWVDAPGWIAALSNMLLIIGLVLAFWATQRLDQRTWWRFSFIALLAFLFGPLAWTHYLILPLLLLPTALGINIRGGILLVLFVGCAFSYLLYRQLLGLQINGTIPMLWGLAATVSWVAGLAALLIQSRFAVGTGPDPV